MAGPFVQASLVLGLQLEKENIPNPEGLDAGQRSYRTIIYKHNVPSLRVILCKMEILRIINLETMRLIQSIPSLLKLDHRARVLFQHTEYFVACWTR